MKRIQSGFARLIILLAVVLSLAGAAFALEVPAKPLGRVSDFAGLLSDAERSTLEAKLEQIETANSNQFALAIFKTLEGDSLEDFSIRLADKWAVGQKGKDNGLLILVFVEDRKLRIEVGKGLEGVITDALSSRVIRNVIAPKFREGKYAEALSDAVTALDQASRGEFTAETAPKKKKGKGDLPLSFVIMAIIFAVVFGLSRRRGGPGGIMWVGPMGGVGGFRGGSSGFGGFSGGGGGFGGGGSSGGW